MATNSATKTPDVKDIKDKVVEGAKDIKDRVVEGAHDAKDAVKGFVGQIGERADDATTAAGRGMQSVAETIRENTPDKGMVGAASRAVSDTIAKGGEYLEKHHLGDMGSDLTTLIRNNPVPALLIAAGVGFLLARACSRS